MSHEITQREDGTVEAAYAGQPAWHGLGTVIDHPMTSLEALRLAHLDWTVEQWSLRAVHEDGIAPGLLGYMPVEGWFANVRQDNREVLGVVSQKYGLLQNYEAFDFMDALQDDGVIRYESAFSIRGGRRVAILARMDPEGDEGTEIRFGDSVKKYALFLSSHDGSAGVQVLPTQVRVVCSNTIRMALGIAHKFEILSIKHVGDVRAKLDDAKRILGFADDAQKQMVLDARRMATYELELKEWYGYLDTVAPIPELDVHGVTVSKRRQTACEKLRETVSDNFHGADSQRTVWDAYNSVSQYVDHQAPRRSTQKAESRFNSLMFGVGHEVKTKAWKSALDLVDVMSM